ncbi:MAG: ribonuclease P protein component [Planctomycetaceae bacterium]
MTRLQYTFSKSQRLRSAAEFKRVYDQRHSFGDRRLLVFVAANGLAWTRIGLSVSRKHGCAVTRARLKRLLREAFRLSQHQLPSGWDLILIPRAGGSGGVNEFRESLTALSIKAARQLTVG